MNNRTQNFRPTAAEINAVSARARQEAGRGTVGGAIAGALTAGRNKKRRLVGAIFGGAAGNVIGRAAGRREGASDVRRSRAALLKDLEARLGSLEQFAADDRAGRAVFDRDASFDRLHSLAAELGGSSESVINLEVGTSQPKTFGMADARQYFAEKVGHSAVAAMSDLEIRAHFLGACRNGLIELAGTEVTTDLIDSRLRAPGGTFLPGGQISPAGVSRAYSPNPKERRTLKKSAEAVGGAGVVAAAILGHRKLRRARAPRLDAGGQPIVRDFAADGSWPMRGLAAATGVRPPLLSPQGAKLNADGTLLPVTESLDGTYPRRGALAGATLRKLRRSRAARMAFARNDDSQHPLRNGAIAGTGVAASVLGAAALLRRRKRLRLTPGTGKVVDVDATALARRNMKTSPFGGPATIVRRSRRGGKLLARLRQFGIGSALVEGAIDAAGLGSATDGTKKRRKIMVDRDGNPLPVPTFLPDPGTTSTASFAIGKLGGIARKFGPDALTIGAADLTAEEVHDALARARAKKQKRAGGAQAVPGNGGGPQTMAALRATLNEFADTRGNTRRRAGEAGAVAAGAAAGAYVGLRHDSGVPIRPGDIQPGMRVTKRFGPGGLFQHVGVVGEDGNVTHRTSGSSKYRSVKPSTFQKSGKGPMRHEVHSDDLPPREAAANATRAAGTRAGKYSACRGNNCQDAAERLISKNKPVSRQLRKAVGGAAAGAATIAAAQAILARRRKEGR